MRAALLNLAHITEERTAPAPNIGAYLKSNGPLALRSSPQYFRNKYIDRSIKTPPLP